MGMTTKSFLLLLLMEHSNDINVLSDPTNKAMMKNHRATFINASNGTVQFWLEYHNLFGLLM